MRILRRLAFILAFVVLANFAVWALVNQSVSERAWEGAINGLSYSGYQEGDAANHTSDADIERDMAVLDGHTIGVRTYGVGEGSIASWPPPGAITSTSISAHGFRATRGTTPKKSRMRLTSSMPIRM